ncbi:MAG: ATP-dependent Clp protease proteolytic subunit [Calditrichaeota bacterium]|nr:MAG: ATP-dependent Clp protease proteolytic subunit [Calditrichota bacterium]
MYFFDAEEKDNNEKENTAKNKSIAEKLFEARAVFLCGEINQKIAKETMMMLTALAADSDDDITIYLNSQGGHVESGDTIHDIIRFVKPRIRIVGTGWVASAGTHIYLSVPKDDRLSLPNTRFLIHQPMGGVGGQATDIDIEAKEIVKMRRRLNEIIARETGQPIEKVSKDTDRNYWMSAEEAIEYGIAGKIINSIDELK